ncbi:MAG: dihydrolipoamide acetyltransferase family protein [Alkalispirochaetaceae bacterium]
MATEVIMPKAGMAMEKGTVIQWFKKPGEYVEAGEPLLEIETDKVAMEVEAEVSGYLLKILHEAGDEVEVIEPIGYIGEEGETAPEGVGASAPAAGSAEPSPGTRDTPVAGSTEPSPGTSSSVAPSTNGKVPATPAARRRAGELGVTVAEASATGSWGEVRLRDVERLAGEGEEGELTVEGVRISPLAKKLAEERRIDLSRVEGSGPGGRILKRDVAEQGQPAPTASAGPTARSAAPAAVPVTQESAERSPLKGMRKTISERMHQSHMSVPPVTLNRKVVVDELLALRKRLNEEMDSRISINDFIVKAVAVALKEAPYMRTTIEGRELVEMREINIGIAVALEEGLMVPVVRNVDTITLSALSDRSKDLARRARDRKLDPDELRGGSFTVTNLGMYGITSFTPIVNLPESAILGVNTVEEELFLEQGEVKSRKVMTLSLTIDHRVIDGAQGAIFLDKLAKLIETPVTILV